MTRSKAALSHFLLSLTIFSLVIFILLFFWYPAPYFTASGGWQGLKIVAGVDLVLGPLLTLIVFDVSKGKVKLMGDLIIIAVLQFSALAWGVNTIYSQRPVAVVFWENSFITVPAAALNSQVITAADLTQYGNQTPVFIYAEKPNNVTGLEQMLERMTEHALPPHHQLELYRPFAEYYAEIKTLQVDINEIVNSNEQMKQDLMQILQDSNTEISDYDYFPLRSKYHSIILMFDHQGQLKNNIVVPLRK